MRIAYVLYGEILSPAVHSQTFSLLRRLRERGHRVLLASITSPRRFLAPRRYRAALRAADEASGGGLRVLTHLPWNLSSPYVAGQLRRSLCRFSPDVVHCRQSRAVVAARRARCGPLVADLRGVRPEELLLTLGKREADLGPGEARRLLRLRAEDREALARSEAVVCVSEPFRGLLGGGPRISAIPNAAEEIPAPGPAEREGIRASFGLRREDLAFVYSGSLAPWQCVRETVRLFARIRRIRPEARLVLLTHAAAEGRKLLSAEGVGDGIVRALSSRETRAVLPAFDYGLLLRRPNLVNRVAAPVKFAEYLHAGLPVVLSEGVGDTAGWVREHGLGVLLSSPEGPGNATRVCGELAGQDPGRCRRFARERLTFEVTVPLYERIYRAAAAASVGSAGSVGG